jgi:serine/threonine-protein kinase
VPGFLLARKEVTFREYLEFLNDPETLGRLARREPDAPGVKILIDTRDAEVQRILPEDGLVELIPKDSARRVLDPRSGKQIAVVFVEAVEGGDGYRLNRGFGITLECPVVGLQAIAGLEYARWLGRKYGGKWVFRLPTDLEWEKAARGVDRRMYVWGSYPDPIYAYCNSKFSAYRSDRNDLADTGTHPLDESLYGILDLAGSAKERVLTPIREGIPAQFGRFTTVRGGSWDDTDFRDFRAATRNRHPAGNAYLYLGLRLAADLLPE